MTIVDGSPMDADGLRNGKASDPFAAAGNGAVVDGDGVSSFGGSGSGGCSLSSATTEPAKRADWTLMGGLLTVLGFLSLRRRRKQKR